MEGCKNQWRVGLEESLNRRCIGGLDFWGVNHVLGDIKSAIKWEALVFFWTNDYEDSTFVEQNSNFFFLLSQNKIYSLVSTRGTETVHILVEYFNTNSATCIVITLAEKYDRTVQVQEWILSPYDRARRKPCLIFEDHWLKWDAKSLSKHLSHVHNRNTASSITWWALKMAVEKMMLFLCFHIV